VNAFQKSRNQQVAQKAYQGTTLPSGQQGPNIPRAATEAEAQTRFEAAKGQGKASEASPGGAQTLENQQVLAAAEAAKGAPTRGAAIAPIAQATGGEIPKEVLNALPTMPPRPAPTPRPAPAPKPEDPNKDPYIVSEKQHTQALADLREIDKQIDQLNSQLKKTKEAGGDTKSIEGQIDQLKARRVSYEAKESVRRGTSKRLAHNRETKLQKASDDEYISSQARAVDEEMKKTQKNYLGPPGVAKSGGGRVDSIIARIEGDSDLHAAIKAKWLEMQGQNPELEKTSEEKAGEQGAEEVSDDRAKQAIDKYNAAHPDGTIDGSNSKNVEIMKRLILKKASGSAQ
jgi:hypothetical protein